ncbi:hypothetical protein ACLOJK_023167 [Asimina triloba]
MAKGKAGQGRSICLQVAIIVNILLVIVIDGVAAATPNQLYTKTRRLVKPIKKPAATIKTIKLEDEDIIDCVDIYKQPAFDHPALRNHTIQMRPSDHTEEMASNARSSSSIASPAQPSSMNESCPERTIPILRPRKSNLPIENSPTVHPIVEILS